MINEKWLSEQIENMLVERDLRGMKRLQTALTAGYCLRAAQVLRDVKGTVLIGTGFPVADTFETDGPVGALILYRALALLGATPILVCDMAMANAFKNDYCTFVISAGREDTAQYEVKRAIDHFKPEAIIAIECPGLAENGRYYNMRGQDISARAACFDYFMTQADCPTLAIGDGGNEIGMGNVKHFLAQLAITPSVTTCDELIIADVSNWGVYGILAFLSLWSKQDLLALSCPVATLSYISNLGSVDGITLKNELTEDSLPASEGVALIASIRAIIGF